MFSLPVARTLAGVTNLAGRFLQVCVSRAHLRITASNQAQRTMCSDDLGSGAGRGGGSGGAIREAGGALGRREAAQEEQYFRKKQAEQLRQLSEHIDDEIRELQKQIRNHEEAIKRLQMKIESLRKKK